MKTNNKTAAALPIAVPTPCPERTGPQDDPQCVTETALWQEGMQMQMRAYREWAAAHPKPVTAPTARDSKAFLDAVDRFAIAEERFGGSPESDTSRKARRYFHAVLEAHDALLAVTNDLLQEAFEKGRGAAQ